MDRLFLRQHLRDHLVHAYKGADVLCGGAAVSREQHHPEALLAQSSDGGGAGLLHRIRHGDQPQQRPVSGEEHGRFPLSRQGVSLFGKGGDVHAAFLHQPAVARQHRPAGEDRPKAPSGEQFKMLRLLAGR